MKRSFVLVFVLVAFVLSLAMPLGSVMAAGKTATLVEFKHVDGKGWTLVFKINGDWKRADLKGNTIKVGNNTYPLSCNFRDESHVSCTMQGLGKNIGTSAVAQFGGQTFSATVPNRQICTGYGLYSFEPKYGGWWYYEISADEYDYWLNVIVGEWGSISQTSSTCIQYAVQGINMEKIDTE